MSAPSRGEIWWAKLNPVVGRKQGGRRPCLVVSVDAINHGPAGTVTVLPITSKDKRIPLHVRIDPPEGGLTEPSFVKIEDIRSISKQRLGRVTTATMAEVADRLRILLDLH
jgi:mRNA interferase MazF